VLRSSATAEGAWAAGELTDRALGAQLREPVRVRRRPAGLPHLWRHPLARGRPGRHAHPVARRGPGGTVRPPAGPAVSLLRRDRDDADAVLRAWPRCTSTVSTWTGLRPSPGGRARGRRAGDPVAPAALLARTRSGPPRRGTRAGHHRAPLLPSSPPRQRRGTVLSGRLDPREHPWLGEHRLNGSVVLPTAAYLELLVGAGDAVGCGRVAEVVSPRRWFRRLQRRRRPGRGGTARHGRSP